LVQAVEWALALVLALVVEVVEAGWVPDKMCQR
jgi:hypothetical protein